MGILPLPCHLIHLTMNLYGDTKIYIWDHQLGQSNLGSPNTNPSSGREEDLNPGPTDYNSSALTTKPTCLYVLQI